MTTITGVWICVLLVLGIRVNAERKFVKEMTRASAKNPKEMLKTNGDFSLDASMQIGENKLQRWRQTFSSVPVAGAGIGSRVTVANNIEGEIVGSFIEDIGKLNLVPKIRSRVAMATLKSAWKHRGSNLIFREFEPQLQIFSERRTADPLLVWYVSYFVDHNNPRRAPASIGQTPALIEGYVNAATGELVESLNALQNVTLVIENAVHGNRKTGKLLDTIIVDQTTSTDCVHRNASNRVQIFDYNGRTSGPTFAASPFKCSQATVETWDKFSTTGGYSARTDAYINSQIFVDMYRATIGLDPFNGANPMQARVHYRRNYENAFFDGTAVTFGDGASLLYPLSGGLDIVCHEWGHSITAFKGKNLQYSGESGAMNEAYSDMTGEACEFFHSGANDFLVGVTVMRTTRVAIRDMCNPALFGGVASLKSFTSTTEVHSGSGIYNKAFCSLSKLPGWNALQSWKVFTTANIVYWSRFETMNCGACGAEKAAGDLNLAVADVTSAFATVDVSCSACTAQSG